MSEGRGIENLKASCESYRQQLEHADAALAEADKRNTNLLVENAALKAAGERTDRMLDLIERLMSASWRQA